MEEERRGLFQEILAEMDRAYDLMFEYDSMPHRYGDDTLYQMEAHTIQEIGRRPGITVTDLAARMGKTPSACSQQVRKLRDKGWVSQTRNTANNREYNLKLTGHGWAIFRSHEEFDNNCYLRSYEHLAAFSEQQLRTYLAVQREINAVFELDVQENQELFGSIPQK